MESRFQRLLLTLLITTIGAPAFAATPAELELEPLAVKEPERRKVKVAKIDNENFEIGIFGGMLNVVDFGSNPVTGIRAAVHLTEDFFIEGNYGRSQLDRTSYERLSGSVEILTPDQRKLSYYNLSAGYNVLPGEAFVGKHRAFTGALYLLGGVGATEFAGDQRLTLNFGVGYRMVATDWLALNVTVRDHIFDSDLLGEKQTYHNLEFSAGLTFFF